MMPFVKMHGCGNDFVVLRSADLDALALDAAALERFVQRACDRHYGIGADGLLAYAAGGDNRLRMAYWNRDGSRAEMCGNGARCVVRLAWERGEVRSPLVLETDAGHHAASVLLKTLGRVCYGGLYRSSIKITSPPTATAARCPPFGERGRRG